MINISLQDNYKDNYKTNDNYKDNYKANNNEMLNVVICSQKKKSSYISNKDPCHDFDQSSLNQRRRKILIHKLIPKMS